MSDDPDVMASDDDLVEDANELAEGTPTPPQPSGGPPEGHPHRQLWQGVRRALYALPSLFNTGLRINGVRATDLHTLNGSLGASIEQSVVDILNTLRDIWDPIDKRGKRLHQDATFVRQSQNWPDVLLITHIPGSTPLMGIELKGWFVLSKEGEPSFRYKVNPDVCTEMDLLAVFPWHLNEVLSGTPLLMAPFVEEARYAALMRNHYWKYSRQAESDTRVRPAVDRTPYPKHGAKFLDTPVHDGGSNFGRASRAGIMRDFIGNLFQRQLAGIPVKAWQAFFKAFRETADLGAVITAVTIRQRQARSHAGVTDEDELARFLRSVLDYTEHVSGTTIEHGGKPVPATAVKVSMTVVGSDLLKQFDAQPSVVALITMRSGSVTLTARGSVPKLRPRLQALAPLAEDVIKVDLIIEEDGLMTIKAIRKA